MAVDAQRHAAAGLGTELLDALVTSVFLLDADLRVRYLNAAAQTLVGLSANQALGRRINELARGADSLLPLFEHALAGVEGVVQRELSLPGPAARRGRTPCSRSWAVAD